MAQKFNTFVYAEVYIDSNISWWFNSIQFEVATPRRKCRPVHHVHAGLAGLAGPCQHWFAPSAPHGLAPARVFRLSSTSVCSCTQSAWWGSCYGS